LRREIASASRPPAAWRYVPAGLSAADADRVRRDHPLWQAIIDLKQTKGYAKETRLVWAARIGHLVRVRELCDWRADVEATDFSNSTPLIHASNLGHLDVVREFLSRGANVNAVSGYGWTALLESSYCGHVEVVRVLLAAGADKHHVSRGSLTATSIAGDRGKPGSRAAIIALLAAAP
jgi:ankyrin repeat protein